MRAVAYEPRWTQVPLKAPEGGWRRPCRPHPGAGERGSIICMKRGNNEELTVRRRFLVIISQADLRKNGFWRPISAPEAPFALKFEVHIGPSEGKTRVENTRF